MGKKKFHKNFFSFFLLLNYRSIGRWNHLGYKISPFFQAFDLNLNLKFSSTSINLNLSLPVKIYFCSSVFFFNPIFLFSNENFSINFSSDLGKVLENL